jgi:predicted small integral membrane protein
MQPNIGTGLGWMAWTWQTALFFGVIALLLVLMTVLEIRRPGGDERRGVLGLVTTRGDRLFISLLATGYVHLLWLAVFGAPLWAASAISLVLALLVFRYV